MSLADSVSPPAACLATDDGIAFACRTGAGVRGVVSLRIPADTPRPSNDLQRACLASGAEALFTALERWWDDSFDITPSDAGELDTRLPLCLRVRQETTGDTNGFPAATLRLRAEDLIALPSLLAALPDGCQVSGEALPCHCEVSRVRSDDVDLQELESGSLLLLAESFEEIWHARLCFSEISIPGRLDRRHPAFTGDDEAVVESGDDTDTLLRVHLDDTLPLDPTSLADDTPLELRLPGSLASLGARVLIPTRENLAGVLTCIGDGYGVLLGDVADTARASDITSE